jgi:hypothetical protein
MLQPLGLYRVALAGHISLDSRGLVTPSQDAQ